MRFGAYDAEVLDRLTWMGETLAPVLAAGLAKLGGLDLLPLMAQALHMGDEVHNRNAAATSLFLRRIAPAILESDVTRAHATEVIAFIAGNDHFFLNISMAACKAMTSAAQGVAGSSMVTVMARNGVAFGIRVSGTGDRWFTRPAPRIDGLFFPGYSADDAAADLGDSAITETAGIGGFAMAAAPAIVQFVGGTPADALRNTREMGLIQARAEQRAYPARARICRDTSWDRRPRGARYQGSRRSSTPASPIRIRGSARSAPG